MANQLSTPRRISRSGQRSGVSFALHTWTILQEIFDHPYWQSTSPFWVWHMYLLITSTFNDMAIHWEPLDERALLWTGILTQQLPTTHTRTLLAGRYLPFARETRTIWEGFRTMVFEAMLPDCLGQSEPSLTLPPPMFDAGALQIDVPQEQASDPVILEQDATWNFEPLAPLEQASLGNARATISMPAWTLW